MPGEGTEFLYDIRNQLGEVRQDVSVLGRYGYDSEGLRILKIGDDGIRRYTYDQLSVITEANAGNTTVSKYDYGLDQLVGLDNTAEGRSFLHLDALGSTVSLTEATGAVRQYVSYDAWGGERDRVGASANKFTFAGHEKDIETGLVYAKARFYDPELGRFINQDSFLGAANSPPSIHRFLYALSNPLAFVDPTGHQSLGAVAKATEEERARQRKRVGGRFYGAYETTGAGQVYNKGLPAADPNRTNATNTLELSPDRKRHVALLLRRGAARRRNRDAMLVREEPSEEERSLLEKTFGVINYLPSNAREFAQEEGQAGLERLMGVKEGGSPSAFEEQQRIALEQLGFTPEEAAALVSPYSDVPAELAANGGYAAGLIAQEGTYYAQGKVVAKTVEGILGYLSKLRRGGATPRFVHDEYVDYVRPGARERAFRTPWAGRGASGTRRFDDFDDVTGTAFEGNTTPWGDMTERQLARKLDQVASDWALMQSNPEINRIIWFGTEELPSSGLGHLIQQALDGAGIEYWVVR